MENPLLREQLAPKKKKFRFDSFASEFDNNKDDTDVPDNDSGIGEFSYQKTKKNLLKLSC